MPANFDFHLLRTAEDACGQRTKREGRKRRACLGDDELLAEARVHNVLVGERLGHAVLGRPRHHDETVAQVLESGYPRPPACSTRIALSRGWRLNMHQAGHRGLTLNPIWGNKGAGWA